MKTVAEYKEILSHGTVHPATVWGVFDRFYNKAGDCHLIRCLINIITGLSSSSNVAATSFNLPFSFPPL